MAKSQFKSIIKGGEKKAPPADKPWEAMGHDVTKKNDETKKDASEAPVKATEEKPDASLVVYTDVSVCRALGIRRRILAESKTKDSRGTAWDCVGEECGMTSEWVTNYGLKNGIVPKFGMLEKCDGRFVSVRLVGTTPNRSMCLAETIADGRREFVRIRNIIEHPIHYKEHFDCVRCSDHLEWTASPNNARY